MFRRNFIQLAICKLSREDRVQPKAVPLPSFRRCLLVLCEGVSLDTIAELSHSRHRFLFADADFTLRKCRAVCRFNLPRHTRVPLFRGLLDVLAVENEVIPVNATSFENCHNAS